MIRAVVSPLLWRHLRPREVRNLLKVTTQLREGAGTAPQAFGAHGLDPKCIEYEIHFKIVES